MATFSISPWRFLFSIITLTSIALFSELTAKDRLLSSKTKETLPQQEGAKIDSDVAQLAHSINSVGLELYSALSAQRSDFLFSPYSLSSAMAMAYFGADGTTKAQIGRILFSQMHPGLVSSAFSKINDRLKSEPMRAPGDFSLKIANSIWVQKGASLLKPFEQQLSENLRATAATIDFIAKPELARFTINNWVEKNTGGKITNLLPPNSIDANTQLLLVSALYLQGKWKFPFNPSDTKQAPFFSNPMSTKTTQTMVLTRSLRYYRGEKFSLLELPYDHERESMAETAFYILLPHETFGLDKITEGMTAEGLQQAMAHLHSTRVALSLPHFQSSSELSLSEMLKNIGLRHPFSDRADFSAINGQQNLKISDVLQKSFFAIDEKGSEAGVATSVKLVAKSLQLEPAIDFKVDHPFLYFVADSNTRTILFMGKVTNPLSH